MKIRLSEIAARSGVSISTVSRVLNEQPGVSQHTRRQVLTAIDVLGYDRPVRLRARSGGLVGLVLPELENPYFPRLAHHLEISLGRLGLSPVLCSQTLGGVHEDDYVAMLLEHSVAGIVFVSGVHALVDSDPARYQRLLDLGPAHRAGQRRARRSRRALRVHRRRGRRRARRPAPRAHGPPAHRRRARPAALPPRPAQARRLPARRCASAGSSPTTSRSTTSSRRTTYSVEGGQPRGRAAARPRRDRHRLRLRRDGPRRHPRRARAGACGCPRTSRSSAATTAR